MEIVVAATANINNDAAVAPVYGFIPLVLVLVYALAIPYDEDLRLRIVYIIIIVSA